MKSNKAAANVPRGTTDSDDTRVYCRDCRHYVYMQQSMDVCIERRRDGNSVSETRKWSGYRCVNGQFYHATLPHRCEHFDRRR